MTKKQEDNKEPNTLWRTGKEAPTGQGYVLIVLGKADGGEEDIIESSPRLAYHIGRGRASRVIRWAYVDDLKNLK